MEAGSIVLARLDGQEPTILAEFQCGMDDDFVGDQAARVAIHFLSPSLQIKKKASFKQLPGPIASTRTTRSAAYGITARGPVLRRPLGQFCSAVDTPA